MTDNIIAFPPRIEEVKQEKQERVNAFMSYVFSPMKISDQAIRDNLYCAEFPKVDKKESMNQKILLNEHSASEVTGFKVATLRKRRWQGLPPKFLKVGSKVFYDKEVLNQYLDSCVRSSTTENKQ